MARLDQDSFNPRMYRMVLDVLRFNLFAPDLLRDAGKKGEMSIGEYLEKEGYGDGFKEDYLLVSRPPPLNVPISALLI